METSWLEEIRKRTKGVPFSSGRSNKAGRITFDDLVFMPAQLNTRPVDYFKEQIKSETIVGKKSQKPLKLKGPIIVGAMSFGALSKEAKIALAMATTLSGSMANTGEGGMLPSEREKAEKLIVQFSTGRFGINNEVLRQADAVEIKIGQGAKPGSGGLLSKEKVTPEIAKIRNVPLGQDVHSPAYHFDIKDEKDLKKTVARLRELTEGVPIIIKLGAGEIEKDIKIAVGAGPDIIAVDGLEGGTGAAPEVLLNEVGIPTIAALARARRVLDEMGTEIELWIGGGFNKGGDIAKALALGADAVFISFPLLVAMGCLYCRLCYLGRCPKGVASQDPELRKHFNVEEAARQVAQFIQNCTEEVKMIAGAVGKNDIHNLDLNSLRALTTEMAQISGAKIISSD